MPDPAPSPVTQAEVDRWQRIAEAAADLLRHEPMTLTCDGDEALERLGEALRP